MPEQLLQEKIEQSLKVAKDPTFATFDFDNTCIINDIAEATLAYICRHLLLKDMALLGENFPDPQTYHEKYFQRYYELDRAHNMLGAYTLAGRAMSGYTAAEINELVPKVIAEEGEAITTQELYGVKVAKGLAIRSSVKELINFVQSKGVALWIVSASPQPLVQAAMDYYQISGQLIGLANELKNGVFTDVLTQPLSILEGKVACIQKYIHPEQKPVLAVGDSMGDRAMLEYAEIQAVVDRNNELTKIARDRGWYIIKT